MYKCPECNAEFVTSQALGSHITYQHKKKKAEFQNKVNVVTNFINDNPGTVDFLKQILHWEDAELERTKDLGLSTFLGWDAKETAVPKSELNPMLYGGILRLQYRSNKYTNFALTDREATREALKQLDAETSEEPGQMVKLPTDFLDIVELREDEKSLITTALLSPEPVHVLMVGKPASAKSLILHEIKRAFPRQSRYTTGGAVSKAGLEDYLIVNKPRYLCMDEVDYLAGKDQPALLSLMEDGIVTRLKYGKRDTVQLKTWVFGGCNQSARLIPALMSRFFSIKVEAYSQDEFQRVVRALLVRRENVPEDLAEYIAEELVSFTTDVRDAVKIARLAAGAGYERARLEPFIRMMKKGHTKLQE